MKYGVDYHVLSESHRKETSATLKKMLSDPVYFEEQMSRRFKRTKVTVEGKQFNLQGYEPFFLIEAQKEGISIHDIESPGPTVQYVLDGKERSYHPDFYVRSLNLIVEVKSEWTRKLNGRLDEAKWEATRKLYSLQIRTYDSSGRRIGE